MERRSSKVFDSAGSVHDGDLEFICNICGQGNRRPLDSFDREVPTCASCNSTVRSRSIVHMLGRELFGVSLTLGEFPILKGIRGLGMSDHMQYAKVLEYKFDYKNTFFDAEPVLDITNPQPEGSESYDFLISSEVFEHVRAPVEAALGNVHRLLKPHGVFLLTVPYTLEPDTMEHFPGLHTYSLAEVGGCVVLVNRAESGEWQVYDNLMFHGGPGSTLEMRILSQDGLCRALRGAGFSEVQFYAENYLPFGIVHRHNWSLPLAVRKAPFSLNRQCVTDLALQFREHQRRTVDRERELRDEIAAVEQRRAESITEALERTEWALKMEKALAERTEWARKLEADLDQAQSHLNWVNNAFWTKLGRILRILPLRFDRLLKTK